MIDDKFLENLPSDDIEAIIRLTEEFEKLPFAEKYLDQYIRTYTAIRAFANNIDILANKIELVSSSQENMQRIKDFVNRIYDQAKLVQVTNTLALEEEKIKSIRNNVYEYHFTDDDYAKIQALINKMRELLQKSNKITEDHRERLLRRLESIQKELHKRVNNLDKTLGFLLDVSIIVRQTGEGAKPIADLAKEISKLITQVILISKGLPPGEIPPLLK